MARKYTETRHTQYTYSVLTSLPAGVSSRDLDRVRRVMNSAVRMLNKHQFVAVFEKTARTYADPLPPPVDEFAPKKKSKKRRT